MARNYEWTIEWELEEQQTASAVQSAMEPWRCPDTVYQMISIFARCLQVSFPSRQTPKDLFHLRHLSSVPRYVCEFFLSPPEARYASFQSF